MAAPPRPHAESRFLEVQGDLELFDNRVYVAPPEARPVQVLYIGPNTDLGDSNTPLFYLQRALNPTEALAPNLEAVRTEAVTREQILEADLMVIEGELEPQAEVWFEEYLANGGVVLKAIAEGAKVPALLTTLGMKVREAEVDDYAMLEKIDFEHPVLRPFSAPGLRDFAKIHVWNYRQLEIPTPAPENVRILVNYDSGDPALVEVRQGKGRIYLFTSHWTPTESQLALSSKFVPLIYSIIRVAGFENDARRQFYAGDLISGSSDTASVTSPNGNVSTGSIRAEIPGIYTVRQDGEELTYAVNVPFEESQLDPMLAEDFVAQGVNVVGSETSETQPLTQADEVRLETVELEARQKIWKWLILLAIVILLGEIWLANGGIAWTGRQTSPAVSD